MVKKIRQFASKIPKTTAKSVKFCALGILLALFCGAFYIFILKDLPSPTWLSSNQIPQSTQIFDRNDKLLFTIYAQKNQTFVPISDIPVFLQQATIATEDKDFYKHGAIDIKGILRAVYANLLRKQVIQGGSTITQQLVKNSLLTQERTIIRKIKEIILAFATEILYPKNKILEMYLNQSPYGGTAWGAEAASENYFGKHVRELNLSESALLAGLPESPTTFSPQGAHPELAKQKQEDVLQKMFEQKYITKKQMEDAIIEPLNIQKVANSIKAPHFVLYTKELLSKKYGQRLTEQGGLKVKTSLDLNIQIFTEDAVATEVAKLKNQHVGNGAAMVTNPATGEILAMVGSKDYFDTEIDGNVNVTLSNRQPGSAIKPINYATGLVKGLTAATPFVDQKVCFPNPGQKEYCPLNYDGKWHGIVQFRQALGSSINIPAIKVLKYNGIETMMATSSAMGITTFTNASRYGLSLTLGGGEVTMLQMLQAYGVFANQGYLIPLRSILKVTDKDGKILEEYKPPKSPIFGKKVFNPGIPFIISQILSDNGARELAFGTNSQLRIPNATVAVKTGTTNDFRDNWTFGYTPNFVVGVWVGNNDNTPMGNLVSGVTGAAPIWHAIMVELLKNTKSAWPDRPSDIVGKIVCATSGLIPPPDGTADRCPTRYEYFIKGTEPTKVDPGKQKVFIDKTTNDLTKPRQTDNVEERDEIVITDPLGDRYCLSCPHPEPEKPSNP
ncbi:MAG: transglycosylase domain-containing protein [Candidatus Levyibacteriota bacterium]|nr:MAG: transglycosylase domain-containing protein [Candidatus Levybacteria bacterium]